MPPGQMQLTRMRSGRELERHRARQVDHRRLGRGVRLRAVAAEESRHRRGADDRAAATLRLQHARAVLHAEEHAAQQHAHGEVPVLDLDVRDRTDGARHARVVEDAVEAAPGRAAPARSRPAPALPRRRRCAGTASGRACPSCSARATVSSPVSAFRSATSTDAPSRRKRRTVARPMPFPPPVTTAT